MKYRDGYRYQLAEDEVFKTKIVPTENITTEFILLNQEGKLTALRGYAWDGPSGPSKAIVSFLEAIPVVGKWLIKKFLNSFLTPSLGHDAKYQLIRQSLIDMSCRWDADLELKEDCLARKMSKDRARIIYKGVKKFGEFAADPKNKKEVYEVP